MKKRPSFRRVTDGISALPSSLRLSSYARAGTRNQLVILIAEEREKEKVRERKREKASRAICVISRGDKKYR